MEQSSIDEIMNLASELGRMIQDTDVYRIYRELAIVLDSDKEASGLLEDYEARLREFDERQKVGDIIEHYETESLRELSVEVQNHGLIMEFLAAKKNYIDLLEKIQHSLMIESADSE